MGFNPNMNPLMVGAQSINQGMGSIGNAIGSNIAQQSQQNQQAEQMQQMKVLGEKAMSGDTEALSQLSMINPRAAQFIDGQLTQQATQQQQGQEKTDKATVDFVRSLNSAPKGQQEAIFNWGVEQEHLDVDEEDREHFSNPAIRRAIIGEQESEKSNLPAEALAFNDLIKDFTPEQKRTAKQVKAGLKGRAVSNAELTAIGDGTIKSYSDYKVQQKQAEKFAEATGSQRAKLIDKGFESINKANVALRNIDKAIVAIDKGAGVGAIEKLWPSITASSVELDNIRGQMALDVVGATTFGALSAGELNLAKDVALPTGLDTPELKDYLIRKKAAQEKLRDYYNEQIQHLDKGGTVASFLRSKERDAGANEESQDSQALQWAEANPNDPRSVAIMQKLQGKN